MPYERQKQPRKSAAQLKAEGRHIKSGNAAIEDNPHPSGDPVPPSTLTEEEARLWEEVVGSMPEGVLTVADTWVLEKFVVQCCFARACSKEIDDKGMVIEGPNNMLQRNPLIASRQAALNSMQQAADALGLTPTARNRLSAPPTKTDEIPDDIWSTDAPMTTPVGAG